jgi:hypothetical protein
MTTCGRRVPRSRRSSIITWHSSSRPTTSPMMLPAVCTTSRGRSRAMRTNGRWTRVCRYSRNTVEARASDEIGSRIPARESQLKSVSWQACSTSMGKLAGRLDRTTYSARSTQSTNSNAIA